MSVPAIPRVKLTGPAAEGETPLQFLTKLDAADQAILGYAASLEARIAAKEASSVAPGIGLNVIQHSYKYPSNASPAAVSAAKGYLAMSGSGDADGRCAVVFMTAIRFAVINYNNDGDLSNFQFRATILDVSATGVLTPVATTVFGSDQVRFYGTVSSGSIVGFVRVADNILRGLTSIVIQNQYAQQMLVTLTLDEATGTLSVTKDLQSAVTYSAGGSIIAPSQPGRCSRRRGYRVGLSSFVAARVGGSAGIGNTLDSTIGFLQAERNAGSGFLTVQQVTGPSSLQYALDRVSDSVFALLHDEYVPGSPGLPAVLSLVNADDVAVGRIAALRLSNPISGAQKVVAVSPSLVVLAYTSGSAHSYYAVARDPATNALGQIGSLSSAGLLGSAAFELYAISATRFAALLRVSGWRWRLVTFAVNVSAGPGVDPFTQVSSVEFNLGTAIPGAVATDDVAPLCVEFLTGDRMIIASRNYTRGASCVEPFDLS